VVIINETKIELSIVVPCYNEEKILERTIQYLEKFLFIHRKYFVGEVIFVNDGSTDNTLGILEQYRTMGGKTTYSTYSVNMGKGFAVRQGIMFSNYNNILILDTDLSVKPDEIINESLLQQLREDNVWVLAGQRVQVIKQPLYRRFVGNCFSYLHRILFQWDIIDSQNPFKILHNIKKEFVSELKIDGFAYDVELLYKAKLQNIKIKQMSVKYYNNFDSTVTLWKTIRMGLDLFKVRFL